MAEEQEADTQQQGLQGAAPRLVSVAAGAAAGALAVVARKALSGGDGDDEGEADEGREEGATAFDDLDRVAADLEGLVEQLRSASEGERDYRRLVAVADAISEYADQAASAFDAASSSGDEEQEADRRVTDDLMNRIGELTSDKEAEPEAGARGQAEREKASR